MAKTARQYVFDGQELMPEPLSYFVETRLSSNLSGHWQQEVKSKYQGLRVENGKINWDQQSLLQVINIFWDQAFRDVFGRAQRAWVNELVEVRNRLSHDEKFTYDDAERALDTMRRLMDEISASETSQNIRNMRNQILNVRSEEQRRNQERRQTNLNLSVETVAGLKPWRDVVEPHPDVSSGDFAQAEFAANLSDVHKGVAPEEYSDPKAFFARTFLTRGLTELLEGASKRLAGEGGDPVVELQTNFGGGKTHSLLALYHLVGGIKPQNLPGVDQMAEDINVPEKVNRAVLVGTARGPLDEVENSAGLSIKTSWGDLAWQLGGKDGYALFKEQDEKGIAPGSELIGNLFEMAGPCLILIDEWVAYLRQLYKVDGLPAGSFDANLTFVHSLTEAVKVSPQTLLVATLPQSDIEVGGEGGKEALARLEQSFRRVHTTWKAATQEESYEIVRRRLFNDVAGENTMHRDNTVKQFRKMYREDPDSFPNDCDTDTYFKKLQLSYPIHPELFDQLYETWSTIDEFQRTRGILRLMAQVVHDLWNGNDPSVLIMPGTVSLSSSKVEPELTKYLEPAWPAIIASDVDGSDSTPYQIDAKQPNLGKVSATRRVARALFMSTAPIKSSQNAGVDTKQINIGVVQPGEKPVTFNDALHRLSNAARHLHSDTGRYWYTTQQSINKLASDTANQFDEETILDEIDQHLTKYINGIADRGVFEGVHCAPTSSADISDDAGGVRVVVLGVRTAHTSGNASSDGMAEAKNITNYKGTASRVFKNVLVYLAPDGRDMDNLKSAVRMSLAWAQIVRDKDRHNLTQSDLTRAQDKEVEAKQTLETRLRESWKWIIYPYQTSAHEDIQYQASKLNSQDRLFDRIQKKLEGDNVLFSTLGPQTLNKKLESFIWHDNPHLKTKDLLEYHDRYIYMPRLTDKSVLKETIQSAVSQSVPGQFAYAESYDDNKDTYEGLVIENGLTATVSLTPDSVIVRPSVAEQNRPSKPSSVQGEDTSGDVFTPPVPENTSDEPTRSLPKQFKGSVSLSADRPARDMSKIIEGIIEQLTAIEGADVELTLEIHADVPDGIDSNKRRTLMENAATLGFTDKDIG